MDQINFPSDTWLPLKTSWSEDRIFTEVILSKMATILSKLKPILYFYLTQFQLGIQVWKWESSWKLEMSKPHVWEVLIFAKINNWQLIYKKKSKHNLWVWLVWVDLDNIFRLGRFILLLKTVYYFYFVQIVVYDCGAWWDLCWQ